MHQYVYCLLISNLLVGIATCYRIEEAKRAIKRPSEHDRYADVDRKRPANDRRFEPPPPPRFDTSINR